jgi:hypothetical protein
MLKLGDVLHVTVTNGVNAKYQTGVLPLSGRRALSERTGKPAGALLCEAMLIDDPPPALAAGTVPLPLNPPDDGKTKVPPLAGIVTMQLLPEHDVAPPGVPFVVPPPPPLQPPAASAPNALSRNSTRNEAALMTLSSNVSPFPVECLRDCWPRVRDERAKVPTRLSSRQVAC